MPRPRYLIAFSRISKKRDKDKKKQSNKPRYTAKDANNKASSRIKTQGLHLNTPKYVKTKEYMLEKLKLRWSPEQISGRPKEVDKLKRYGDLEGDTIFGQDTKDRILTHTDRKSGVTGR